MLPPPIMRFIICESIKWPTSSARVFMFLWWIDSGGLHRYFGHILGCSCIDWQVGIEAASIGISPGDESSKRLRPMTHWCSNFEILVNPSKNRVSKVQLPIQPSRGSCSVCRFGYAGLCPTPATNNLGLFAATY